MMHESANFLIKSAGFCGLLIISACQWVGEGPVTLSSFSSGGWTEYSEIVGDKAFAITTDGASYGYAFCTDVRCSGNEESVAIESCENGATAQGLPEGQCRLFARDNNIVWQGDVAFTEGS